MIRKTKVTLTTSAGGVATATTDRPLNGCIYGIYVAQGDLASTADLTITQNDGQGELPVLLITDSAASAWHYPVISATHYTGSGTTKTDGMVPVAGYVTVAVASGGATKTGTVYILVEE